MLTISEIKENIKCPQFGDLDYGKWGALRLEQRQAYKHLIEIVESQDKEIERLNKELQDTKEHLGEYLYEQEEENKKLNNIINESAEEILKELEENHHLSYGVALAIRQKLIDYRELKGSE